LHCLIFTRRVLVDLEKTAYNIVKPVQARPNPPRTGQTG
jgi:hypothetical protein